MKNLVKNLKPYWHWIIVLVLVLSLQAYSDLALPAYTQDIIDVGIQNKGIEHIIPEKIQAQDYESATVFMTEDEKTTWEKAFDAKATHGVYARRSMSEEALDAADKALLVPLVMPFRAAHTEDLQDAAAADHASGAAATPGGGDTDTAAARAQMQKVIDTVGDKTLKAMGVAYAAECDARAGVDVDARQTRYLWIAGAKMGLMALLMFLSAGVAALIASRVGAGVGRDLRRQLYRNVMAFSDGEMSRFQTASLITRATNDVQQVQMVSTMMLRMVLFSPIMGLWGIIKVARTGADMGYIVALAVLMIIALVGLLMAVTMPKFRIMQTLIDGVNLVAREILTGLSVIRAFTREKEEQERFDKANTELMRIQLFTSRVMALMHPSMQLIMFGLTVVITWASASRIDDGTLQVGAMTAFITYSIMIVMSFLMLTVMSILLPRAGVAADRIQEVIQTVPAIQEPTEVTHIREHTGTVRFEHVSFRYPDADMDIIKDIDFEARPGETTAIIGSTGCGKSSLVHLIPRFYDVSAGRVLIDGVDVRELPLEELRRCVGFVPQKGVLFSGTIASNLRFGDSDASEEELKRAAEIAQADGFVQEKEKGYDSAIAQGGSNVSGGQKQRLAIARAIARKPEILIFDDSFSALDMKTDAALRRALAEELSGTTRIIVAQRISTILHAEQILVMDEGRIVGQGTHEELMRSCRVYREIADSQLSSMELEAM